MQILIEIPEEKYNTIKNKMYCGIYDAEVYESIVNGTPLPKGHGRLIDADVVDDNIYDLTRGMDLNYSQIISVLDGAPTIIPADKE